MPKHRHRGMIMEGLIMPTKVRKRGCSSSSSSSSRIHHYRLNKRAIVVDRSRPGLGGSRSGTPAPTWGGVESPKYSQSGKSTQPVSARRLAASLWEMNEIPSPKLRKSGSKMVFKREKMQSAWGLQSSSDSLPPHLSDSSTVSEVDRSGLGSRRTPSISHRLKSSEQNAAVCDSVSHASFMEIESRSRPPTSNGSVSGNRNRLKDVSNALTTSKELLKIINRLDHPSSSISIISALHAELERARIQVNHLIHDQRTDKTDINNLMKCFAEEKISHKNRVDKAIESAVASVTSELEVERKLRRRLEGLNKKLGKDLVEMKSSFVKAVEELESEKRARGLTEQLCDELARNVDEDRAEVEKLKSEAVKLQVEAEKEREMLELADKLREGRVQMKMHEAKHHFEEKTSAISKLRKQLEAFLGAKREKGGERATCLSKSNIKQDEREVEEATYNKEESVQSENHHLIELISPKNTSKIKNWTNSKEKLLPLDESKARNSISEQIPRRSATIQKRDGFEKEASRRSYLDETQRQRALKGLLDHVFSSPRSSVTRDCCSPSQQPLPSRRSKW